MRVKNFFQTFDVNPISADPMHGPVTPELIEYIRERNEEKRLKSIEFLGEKWLLHPNNQKQKEAR